MKVLKEGLSGLIITDAGSTEAGEASFKELSRNLEEFYSKRGYVLDKILADKSLKLKVMAGKPTGIEVTVSHLKSSKHSNRSSGDNTEYYTYVFSARFNGPGELPFKHRDAFINEYA